ncbi:MAG TPA: hypothetical protein VNF50_13815 [Acidimicrobiales bacterium]|nr:hypothetical protein [Acidimicrobiales bacterium]
MKPTIPLVAAVMAMGAIALGVSPEAAHAAGNVTVTLSSVSPSETVSITDLQGNDLTTEGLSLGSDNPLSSSLSSPFEVTVADANQTPSGFTIDASMTNLYKCSQPTGSCSLPGTEPTGNQAIPSTDVSLAYPTSGPAMAVENVSALAAPVFTVAGNLPSALCTAAALLNTNLSCTSPIPISATVAGVGQTLAQSVNLASLNNLPLLPQTGTAGRFQTPTYGYGAASTYGSKTLGTALAVLTGSETTSSTVLSALQAQISGAGAVPNSYLNTTSLNAALQSALVTALGTVNTGTTAVGDSVWVELENAPVNPYSLASVEPSLASTLVGLGSINPSCTTSLISCIVGISGTYRSFPILNVAVPAGTANGNFEGTLVFTGF